MADLVLADGFSFEDLYSVEGLARLDAAFLSALEGDRPDLAKRFKSARLDAAFAASLDSGSAETGGPDGEHEKLYAVLLIDLAPCPAGRPPAAA